MLLLHTDIISYRYKQFSNATLLSIGERGDCFYCPSSRNVAQTTIRRRPRTHANECSFLSQKRYPLGVPKRNRREKNVKGGKKSENRKVDEIEIDLEINIKNNTKTISTGDKRTNKKNNLERVRVRKKERLMKTYANFLFIKKKRP